MPGFRTEARFHAERPCRVRASFGIAQFSWAMSGDLRLWRLGSLVVGITKFRIT